MKVGPLGETQLRELEHLESRCDRLCAAGRYGDARALAQRVLDLREADAAARPAAYAAALLRAGRLNGKLADYTRAEQQLRQSLYMLGPGGRKKPGEGPPVLRALADVLAETGRYAEADTLYCQAIGIVRENHGERSAEFARHLHALSPLYFRARGDLVEAERMLRQSLEIWKQFPPDADYARCLDDYGMVLFLQHRHSAARDCLVQAMELRTSMLGMEHIDCADSQASMARLLIDEGDTSGAAPLVEAATRTRAGVLGEMHPLYAECLVLQAEILRASGDCLHSRPLLAKAEDIVRRTAGTTSGHYLLVVRSLDALCHSAGDLLQCLAVCGRIAEATWGAFFDGTSAQMEALDLRAARLIDMEQYDDAQQLLQMSDGMARQNPRCTGDSLVCHLEVAAALSVQRGRLDEAQGILEEILGLRTGGDGAQAVAAGRAHACLACLLARTGNSAAALDHAGRSERIVRGAVGEEHFLYADNLCARAEVFMACGDFEQAEEALNTAARIRRSLFGDHHPAYATCLEMLAGVALADRQHQQALELQQQAADIREKVCGADSGRFASALVPLADIHTALGHHARAEELLMKALGILQMQVGENHSEYMSALYRLAGVQAERDDLPHAESTLEKLLMLHGRGGRKHPAEYAKCLGRLAGVSAALERLEQADEFYRELMDVCRGSTGAIPAATMAAYMMEYGDMMAADGDADRAAALYRQARAMVREVHGAGHPHYRAACERLVRLRETYPGLFGWRRLLGLFGLD